MTTLITPLPTPPTRQDSTNFNDRADEFLGSLPLFQQEANGLAIDVQAIADEVEISRQAIVSVTNITKWVSGNTYSEGVSVWSPINGIAYRKITSSSGGTTDPSLDDVNYKSITDASGFIYTPAGTGAVATTINAALSHEPVNVFRYMTEAEIQAVQTNTWTTVSHVTDAIKAAIIDTVGAELVLPPGTYRFNKSLSFTNHNISGTPKKTVLKAVDFDIAATDLVTASGATKTTVSGITLDCTFFTSANKATYPGLVRFFRINSTELTVENCDVLGDATFDIDSALDTTGASYVTVRGCLVKNIKGDALAAVGYKLLIDGNRIINVRRKSGSFANRAVIAGQSEELIFTNNYIQDTEWVSTVFDSVCGIDVGGGNRIVISGNIFKNVAVGTDFEASTAPSGDSSDVICTNNVFSGDGLHGHGIWINYGSASATRILIDGNTVSGYDKTIACSTSRGTAISNNILSNFLSEAINISSSYDFSITGNTIISSSGKGIVVSGVNDNFCGGVIANNMLSGVFSNEAIDVSNFGSASGSSELTPREPVLVCNNVVHDTRSVGSRTARVLTFGNVVSHHNTVNHQRSFASSFDVSYGNGYTVDVTGAQTLTDLVNGSAGQEVEIVFKVAAGGSIAFDFTSSNLSGNGGSDLTIAATGSTRLVRMRALRVFRGSNVFKWVCQVSDGY